MQNVFFSSFCIEKTKIWQCCKRRNFQNRVIFKHKYNTSKSHRHFDFCSKPKPRRHPKNKTNLNLLSGKRKWDSFCSLKTKGAKRLNTGCHKKIESWLKPNVKTKRQTVSMQVAGFSWDTVANLVYFFQQNETEKTRNRLEKIYLFVCKPLFPILFSTYWKCNSFTKFSLE